MRVVINLSTGRYIKGQMRLFKSLSDTGYAGKFLSWTDELAIGAPYHRDNPYGFKIYGFEKGFEAADSVLWLDASVWAIKDVSPIFEHIEGHGYIMQEAGHSCGRWANDRCLEYFDLKRDDASKMPMYGNAGFLGLNKNSAIAMEFFKRWKQSMLDGIFKGEWSNHRHDMVCGSIIANRLGMKYQKGNEWLAYASPEQKVNKNVILKAQGL